MTATWRTAGCCGDGGLDLAEFDAEAADLDLLVDAAEVFEVAVGEAAGQIAGAVQAPAVERVGHEALRGQLGAVEIAVGDAGAGDVHLAGDADRHRLAVRIEQVDPKVGDRHADDAAGAGVEIGPGDRPVGHVHGGLGDAVHVDQPWRVVAVAVEPGAQALQLQRLAAEDDVAQRERARRRGAVGVDELRGTRTGSG